ncbi:MULTISPECIES: hypothetical protein [unclassified Lentimonas]|uniref:hypothetical protein n=1 Tax=unclassified Lentimonas TaxID=2630993 RepID=UPI001323D040|nr:MULTISPECIES: hypothetical protein [unclassified Lentimonas]CAA6679574.1 Unannotated [Lentimonas sp. CC4]CAA6687292.1 Unannotated [Lentimonas sp. CC6]CAA6696802.1 Unannotated [Lentimonas sp. CC19]CAA6697404.1 Unannotated [Lentimonas sp. CC10]CAA7071335.1 Unannotated [Lentimonas sp. CC11]
MRILFLALLSLLCISCASTKKPAITSVNILDINPRYIETVKFKRITEYLTGKENRGNRVIIRTDKTDRTGYYFVLMLDEKVRDLPAGTYIEGEFYTPKTLDKQAYTFELPSKLPKTKEIFIGLTGQDWTKRSDIPSAWKFTIKNSNGEVLAMEKSYLWSF